MVAPGYVPLVGADFAEHLADFRRVSVFAPRDVTAHTPDEQVKQYQELLAARDGLNAAADARARLALLLGEGEDIGSDVLWLVMNPAGTASLDTTTAALSQFRGQLPSTVDDWEQFAAIGLEMAKQGEVVARKHRFGQAMYASSQTPDRGMQDRTIDEALGSAAA